MRLFLWISLAGAVLAQYDAERGANECAGKIAKV